MIKLANTLDWSAVEKEFAGYFVTTRGRPALSPRLVAGLLYLQHAFRASDEMVVKGCKEAAIDGVQILRSGQRTQSKSLKKMIKPRSSIEPAIGHMKTDGRLARN